MQTRHNPREWLPAHPGLEGAANGTGEQTGDTATGTTHPARLKRFDVKASIASGKPEGTECANLLTLRGHVGSLLTRSIRPGRCSHLLVSSRVVTVHRNCGHGAHDRSRRRVGTGAMSYPFVGLLHAPERRCQLARDIRNPRSEALRTWVGTASSRRAVGSACGDVACGHSGVERSKGGAQRNGRTESTYPSSWGSDRSTD